MATHRLPFYLLSSHNSACNLLSRAYFPIFLLPKHSSHGDESEGGGGGVGPLRHINLLGNFSEILNLNYWLKSKRNQNLTLRVNKHQFSLNLASASSSRR